YLTHTNNLSAISKKNMMGKTVLLQTHFFLRVNVSYSNIGDPADQDIKVTKHKPNWLLLRQSLFD
ncbi:MAG: hypothetical protein ACRD91_02330, partial [Nitrosopumilaceae archaeon]